MNGLGYGRFRDTNAEAAYREKTNMPSPPFQIGRRRCQCCGQHKPVAGGKMAYGNKVFTCADCFSKQKEQAEKKKQEGK